MVKHDFCQSQGNFCGQLTKWEWSIAEMQTPTSPRSRGSRRECVCDLVSLPLSRPGAAVAGIYRVAGKNMAPLEALVWGVGQTVLTLIISFSRILATLWGFGGNVSRHRRKQMYSFSENGVVNEREWNGTRTWKEPGHKRRKALSCVQRSPSGVQVIALPHCTLRASVPGQAHYTTGS